MRAPLLLACVAALLACAHAQPLFELETMKEDTSTPGVTSSTYAIVQDGRVVGVVEHYRSERGSLLFGRRGGPSDAHAASPAATRLADLFASQADSLAALRDRLMATRCPYARQMALARLQMAEAAAHGEQPQLVRRPFTGEEPAETGSASEPGFPGTDMGAGMAVPTDVGAGMVFSEPEPGQGFGAGTAPGAGAQDPSDTPEDFVDFSSAQDQLLGPDGSESDPAQAVTVHMAANGRPILMPRMPAGGVEAGEASNSVQPMMPRMADEEAEVGWASAEEEAPLPPLFGAAGARPLIARRPVGGAEPAVLPEPASMYADDFAETVGAEEEAPRATFFTLVWAGAQPMPRHPEHPPRWGPHHPTEPRPAMHRHHHHEGPEHPAWPRMVGGQVMVQTADGSWVPFTELSRPAPVPRPELGWHLYDSEGRLNWGMVTFVALAVACMGVWGAMLVQWATYKSAVDNHNAAAFFITRVGSEEEASLKPLLHEGPLDGAAVEKLGVEHASAHVAGATVKVLAYEPLKSSDSQ